MTHVLSGEGWLVELDEHAREVLIEAPSPLAADDARELADAILVATRVIDVFEGHRRGT